MDSQLGGFRTCKKSGLYIEDTSICSFAISLDIVCGSCDTKNWDRKEIDYLNKKIKIWKSTINKKNKTYAA